MSKHKFPHPLSEALLIASGAFLVLDALVLHLVTFDYAKIGLGFLDPYVSHGFWGALLVAIGALEAKYG